MIQLITNGNYVTIVINGSIQEVVNRNTDSIEYNTYEDGKISFKIGRRSFDMINPNTVEIDNVQVTSASDFIHKIKTLFTEFSSYIFVADINDFPTPVNSVITLQDDVTYFITNTIDLNGNRLVGGSNTTILGASSEVSILTSTGLGSGIALFTSNYTTPIRHISFNNVDTALFIDGNGNSAALDWTGVNFVNVPNVGIVKNFTNLILNKCAFLNSKGLTLDGTFDTFAAETSLFSGDGFSGNIITIPSTATVTRRIRIIYSSIIAFGSTIGLNVSETASILNETYILDTVNFSGGGTYLAGLQYTDNKAFFLNCKGINNSSEISQYYMNGNATTTVISAINTPVKVLGTTTNGPITQKFVNTDNRATYVGSLTRLFKVTSTLSAESGNNNQVGVYIAKNGTVLDESEVYGTTGGNGRYENIVVQTLVELQTNDYIEIYVENSTGVNNILVTDLNTIIT